MAIWTVNTNADDGSVDTDNHVGSLRGCIGAAASGDTIQFDAVIFSPNVETSILLENALSVASVNNVTIDGGETWLDNGVLKTRVILDAQQNSRIFLGSQSLSTTFNGVTFQNGKLTGSSTQGAGVHVRDSSYNSVTSYFNNCVFKNCVNTSANGGGLYLGSGAKAEVDNCYFITCGAVNGGGIYTSDQSQAIVNDSKFLGTANNIADGGGICLFSGSTATLNNCTFNACKVVNHGGGFAVLSSATLTLTNCTFNACQTTGETNSRGGGGYVSSTNGATINNCVFNNCSSGRGNGLCISSSAPAVINNCTFSNNPSNRNLYVDSTGQITFTGNNVIDAALLGGTNADTNIYISGTLTIGSFFIGVGNTVTFDGTDRILAVTSSTNTTINAATFQTSTSSTGYLALHEGATAPPVGDGVKVCAYGAGVQSVAATISDSTTASLTWTQTNANVPILVELLDNGSWTTLNNSATSPYVATLDSAYQQTFRFFDGSSFLTATTPNAPVDPTKTGFYRINDWAALNWNITSWVDATSGGDGGRDDACAFTVSNWAIDPEINE